MLSRKYYKKFAELIRDHLDAEDHGIGVPTNMFFVHDLMDFFQEDNPHFDRAKFLSVVSGEP